MLYITLLTNKEHGNVCTRFGSWDEMNAHAEHNKECFTAEVRPAHQDEIADRIEELKRQEVSANKNLDNSPWSSGPRYCAQLAEISNELLILSPHVKAGLGGLENAAAERFYENLEG
jgi:hypothetical protein